MFRQAQQTSETTVVDQLSILFHKSVFWFSERTSEEVTFPKTSFLKKTTRSRTRVASHFQTANCRFPMQLPELHENTSSIWSSRQSFNVFACLWLPEKIQRALGAIVLKFDQFDWMASWWLKPNPNWVWLASRDKVRGENLGNTSHSSHARMRLSLSSAL